jgi:VanZ family protein
MKFSADMRKGLRWLWVVCLFMVMTGSLLPANSGVMASRNGLGINDKVMHFSAYIFLAMLPVISFETRLSGIRTALLMILLGVALEGGQHFSPGRTTDIWDAVSNTVGTLCGILLGLVLR